MCSGREAMSLEACGSLVTQHVGINEGRGRAAQLDPGIEEDAQGRERRRRNRRKVNRATTHGGQERGRTQHLEKT